MGETIEAGDRSEAGRTGTVAMGNWGSDWCEASDGRREDGGERVAPDLIDDFLLDPPPKRLLKKPPPGGAAQ
jgi:hypothetical protein